MECEGYKRGWISRKEEEEVIFNLALTAWKATRWIGHDTFISVVTLDCTIVDLSD